jgi:hypothetical protein
MESKLKVLWVFSILLSASFLIAQNAEDKLWHKGYLVLDNQDTLEGLLKYDFRNNNIQYQKGDEFKFLLPGKVTKVFFISSLDSTNHTLDVAEVKTGEDYYRSYFFEMIDTSGKYKIAQQYFWIERVNTFAQFGTFSVNEEKVMNLFIINRKNIATYIKPKKRFILDTFKDKKQEIKEKCKVEHWSYSYNFDIIKIIKYYNSLYK